MSDPTEPIDWDEKAREYAGGKWRPGGGAVSAVANLSIQEGARWQREALLSDETVMRVAQAIYESAPNTWTWTWAEIVGGWKNKPYPDYPHLVDDIRRQARAALTAALGEDET